MASLEVELVSRNMSNISTNSGILQNFLSTASPAPDMFLGLLFPLSHIEHCRVVSFQGVSGVKSTARSEIDEGQMKCFLKSNIAR